MMKKLLVLGLGVTFSFGLVFANPEELPPYPKAIESCKGASTEAVKFSCLKVVCNDYTGAEREECLGTADLAIKSLAESSEAVKAVKAAEQAVAEAKSNQANCYKKYKEDKSWVDDNGNPKSDGDLTTEQRTEMEDACDAEGNGNTAIAEKTKELREAQQDPAYQAYAEAEGLQAIADTEAALRKQQDAFAKMATGTGFFDVSNISVGREAWLEVGGAENRDRNIIARVINVMARLFGTFAVLMFVIGAFFLITSQGDENQLQKGKTIVLYTILGLLIGFTAYLIVQFVISILFQT